MQGRVLDGDYLKGWEKRQPKKEDGSAERSKAWREEQKRKKEEVERLETLTNATERNRPTDTDKTRQNKNSFIITTNTFTETVREPDLSTELVDNFEDSLNFNDITVCFDIVVALLGKEKLDDLDRKALMAWPERYDMRKFILIMQNDIRKRLEKKQKVPNSFRFFEYIAKGLPVTKPPDKSMMNG